MPNEHNFKVMVSLPSFHTSRLIHLLMWKIARKYQKYTQTTCLNIHLIAINKPKTTTYKRTWRKKQQTRHVVDTLLNGSKYVTINFLVTNNSWRSLWEFQQFIWGYILLFSNINKTLVGVCMRIFVHSYCVKGDKVIVYVGYIGPQNWIID